jgi:Putative regulator of cell autolysis
MVFVVIYSLSLGIPSMKAYEYTEWKLEKYIPWLKKPFRRFFISVITQVTIGVIILILINFLFYFLIKGQNITAIFKTTFEGFKYLVAFTFSGIILINCVFFFRSWRQSAINEEKLKREKLAIEYEALKNQVNPHFLFNNLTALSTLVYKDQDKAVHFINELSNVFRYVLESRENEIIDLSTERKLLESIAYLYQIRHEESLRITIDLPDPKDKFVIPMALQMLVENAIKHNTASVSKPLFIEIKESEGYIVVKNNIQPKMNSVSSSKIGLKNIQSRYQYFTRKEVIIEKTDEHFVVKLPILNKER